MLGERQAGQVPQNRSTDEYKSSNSSVSVSTSSAPSLLARTKNNLGIMVVDDDTDILSTIEVLLNECGYHNVDIFSDPIKALEQFRSITAAEAPQSENRYAIILTDIRMPKMDGLQFANEVIKIKADVKIIFMTAFDIREAMSKWLESSPVKDYRYLEKPFELRQLCNKVKEAERAA